MCVEINTKWHQPGCRDVFVPGSWWQLLLLAAVSWKLTELIAAGTHPVLSCKCVCIYGFPLALGPWVLWVAYRAQMRHGVTGRGCLQTVSQEGEGSIWKSREVKAWPEGMSQGLEAAGLERRTEKRKLMQLKLQADLDSNCRMAKRRWHVNHFKPVSSSVKWGHGQVMLDVTPISLLCIPVLATGASVSEF